MTLLLRDTETKTETTGADAPGGEAPEAPAPVAAACPKCGAPVEPGQDWCLNCGEAQASRRLALPGKRAIGTVLALTGVLVIGAVAAAYAALDHTSPAATGTTQVAQVPAPAPTAAAPAPTTGVPSDTAPSSTLPGATDTAPPSTGTTPSIPKSTPTPSVPSTPVTPSVPSTPTGTGSTRTSTGSGTRSDTTSTTRTDTTPELPDPVEIRLDPSAAALYDPYRRDTADPASADPAKALDGEGGTSFPITVADGSASIGAGLVLDLGRKQGVREVDVTTKTPGFKIELYATDETVLPPDITDTRWAHLKDIRDVGTGTDGKVKVDLGAGTTKYRHVLLWLTSPPSDGFTARLSEVRVFG
jgi:hypothetical protein